MCWNKYLISIMAVFFLVSGCASNQTAKDTWKGTKSLYRSYLNVPATVDLENRVDIGDTDSHLAVSAEKVNRELSNLERWIENSPGDFDASWVQKTLKRFPWLSGLALTDANGDVLGKQAQGFMKEFNVEPLLVVDPKQSLSALRAYVQASPLGYEVYLGNPIYFGEDFRGLMVAFFEPRNVVGFSPEPEQLIMASAHEVFWPGVYEASSLPVSGGEWAKTLANRPAGTVSNSAGTVKWTSRYFANLLFAYGVVEKGSFPQNKEQMVGVDRSIGRNYGVGDTPLPTLQGTLNNLQPEGSTVRESDSGGSNGNGLNDVGNIGQPNVHPAAPPQGPVKDVPPVKAQPIAE